MEPYVIDRFVGMFAGVVVTVTALVITAILKNRNIRHVPSQADHSFAVDTITEVIDSIAEQCGEEWTRKSLEGFTLAATVTRAIRWHKDTVSELKHEIECDKRYIAMLESVALSHSNILAGQTQPSEGESVRDFLERRYDL